MQRLVTRKEQYEFTGHSGQHLSAVIDYPQDSNIEVWAYALYIHCFTCNKDSIAAVKVSAGLASKGVACCRFDFSGLNKSAGVFADTNFTSNLADIAAALKFMDDLKHPVSLLVGHSLGGNAAVFAAKQHAQITAVASINSGSQPRHLLKHLQPWLEAIEENGEAEAQVVGRPFLLKQQFVDDLRQYELLETVRSLEKPYCIVQATHDDLVPFGEAEKLYAAASQPKSIIALKGANHLLSPGWQGEQVGQMLGSWLKLQET